MDHLNAPKWFSALGVCRCGRDATGTLMSIRNDRLRPSCKRCAEADIRKAAKEWLQPALEAKRERH